MASWCEAQERNPLTAAANCRIAQCFDYGAARALRNACPTSYHLAAVQVVEKKNPQTQAYKATCSILPFTWRSIKGKITTRKTNYHREVVWVVWVDYTAHRCMPRWLGGEDTWTLCFPTVVDGYSRLRHLFKLMVYSLSLFSCCCGNSDKST